MLSRSVKRGLLEGFRVDEGSTEALLVSQLLFAYNTILIYDALAENLLHISVVLLCSKVVLGLKVNLSKSEVELVAEVGNVEGLVELLCCKVGSKPMTYLAMLLGSPYKATAICNFALEKMEKRFAEWEKTSLSKGVHLTLLKSMLSSLPSYFLSLFTIPTHVAI